MRAARIPCGQPIVLSNPSHADKYLFDIHEELTGPLKPNRVILRNTLENLIQEASRPRPGRAPIPDALLAAMLLRGTALSVGEVGRSVGYDDPYYFSKLFKANFGMPPSRLTKANRYPFV